MPSSRGYMCLGTLKKEAAGPDLTLSWELPPFLPSSLPSTPSFCVCVLDHKTSFFELSSKSVRSTA